MPWCSGEYPTGISLQPNHTNSAKNKNALNYNNELVFYFFLYFISPPRYIDLSVQGRGLTVSPLAEKLLRYKACLRFYDTMEHSYTNASVESIL